MRGVIHHIEINVANLEKSRRFWLPFLTALDYDIYQEWSAGFSMKLEDTYLVFVQTEDNYLSPSFHRKHNGLNHLAFHVASRQELDHWRNWIHELNLKELYPQQYPYAGGQDYQALYFEDPDRLKIELVYQEV
ncbi:VOC family protein [Leuconostoc falkenbergense]|uniref:VOC family protein n=1 Tax=Leuconostoc falkenbergense TaxID=2766470 RepID=UPI0028B0C87D|nr:VOC family protein [Leuconostoc falkenbergense]